MGSDYPTILDDDTTLPRVDDNITVIGSIAINALRSAVFNIEETLGINPAGTAGNLAAFLSVAHNPDGSIQPSVLTSLGLVTLPIRNNQVAADAGILESKLALAYPTTALFSFIQQVNSGTQQALNFITNHGSKIEPHIQGIAFNHYMPAILVAPTSLGYFINYLGLFRDNSTLYNLFNDFNNDFIKHQVANGTPVSISSGHQSGGTIPPTNFAHNSSGIYLNPTTFSFIPQTTTDLQTFAEFVDSSNILLLGSRIQTLYSDGIPRTAISSSLLSPSQGQIVIPVTDGYAFLLDGYATSPIDDINQGDNVLVFSPSATNIANNSFDALFAAVRIGDIATVNYGSFIVSNIVTEKKYSVDTSNPPNKTFALRIAGKNLQNAKVTINITRSLFNNNKAGVLALAQAKHNINGVLSSLIVGNPRSAEVLSVNFNASLIDGTHYNLYLAIYPNGNPLSSIFNVPVIDISGNQGATPGTYTLDTVVQTINDKLRSPGHNNRIMAFSYQGELGIKLTDGIGNISFSILDGVLNGTTGLYSQSLSNASFPNNVIGVPGLDPSDPSGLGPSGAGVSGPQFATSFSSSFAALTPAKIIAPNSRKMFYVNGVEGERLALEPLMTLDGYGDGFWPGVIISRTVIPGTAVTVTYQILLDLSTSGLQVGKTITVISSTGNFVDSGRYFISNIQFNDCNSCPSVNANIVSTNITVYDAIQSNTGITPSSSAAIGTAANLYFSPDSVSFSAEALSDPSPLSLFKRFIEIYVDSFGKTFSHERARMYIGGTNSNFITTFSGINSGFGLVIGSPNAQVPLFGDASQQLISANIIDVSPKLRGSPYGTTNKINLQVASYNSISGDFDGYLCSFSPSAVISNIGPLISGKKGEVARFYDQSGVEFIDILFDIGDATLSFVNAYVDIQLFPTLQLDHDVMLLGTVQINNQSNDLKYLIDRRQFGNISEEQLSTSALDFIASGLKNTMQNGVVRGFDLISTSPLTLSNIANFSGGLALVNGRLVPFNSFEVSIPLARDNNPPNSSVSGVLWAVCANDQGDIQLIPLTDFNPVINAINSPGRLLQLLNTVNSVAYYVDSTIFSSLIGERKDLTVLYLINAQVTNSTTFNFSISDARKFVTNANANSFAVLSEDPAQGNFQSLAALKNWSVYNSSFQDTVILRGPFIFSEDPRFVAGTIFKGDGALLTFNAATTITNVTFNDLILEINQAITIIDCTFNNCTITLGVGGSIDPSSFNNCVININGTTTISADISNSILNGSGTATISGNIFNCSINMANTNIINAIFIGCIFTCSTPLSVNNNCTFNNCTFNAHTPNTTEMINFSGPSYIKITDGYFNRGAISLGSYINISSSSVIGIVTGNIFDSITSNGSNHALISGTISGLEISQNINYFDTYTYPSGSLITAASGSSIFYAAGSTVTTAPISKTIVQPLIFSDQGGDRTSLDLVPGSGFVGVLNGASLCAIQLIQVVNGSTIGTCTLMARASGAQTGDSTLYAYKVNNVTGVMTQIAGPDSGPLAGSGSGIQPVLIGISGVVIDTSIYSYHITISGDTTSTIQWYAPVISFNNIIHIYPPQ